MLPKYEDSPYMFHLYAINPINPEEAKKTASWDYFSTIRYEPSYYSGMSEMQHIVQPPTPLSKYNEKEKRMIYIGFFVLGIYIYLTK